MLARGLLLLALGVALGGCFDPGLEGSALACGDAGCPPGTFCDRGGVCRPDYPDTGENVVLAIARADRPTELLAFCEGAVMPARALDEVIRGRAVAWSDPDGVGQPALAVGNLDDAVRVVSLEADVIAELFTDAGLQQVRGAAWADQDGDGDLDLAVSDHEASVSVLRHDGGTLAALWSATAIGRAYGLAWGDADGDGDLDLAAALDDRGVVVFGNQGDSFQPIWWSPHDEDTRGVGWADLDGDGDVDLVVATRRGPLRVFRNDTGSDGSSDGLALVESWTSADDLDAEAIDIGDLDGDGDGDVAVAVHDATTRVYRNDAGALTIAWENEPARDTWSVDWFDVDGDGDLDLTLGNRGSASQLLRNDGGALVEWASLPQGVRSLAWARWQVPAGRGSACDAARW